MTLQPRKVHLFDGGKTVCGQKLRCRTPVTMDLNQTTCGTCRRAYKARVLMERFPMQLGEQRE